MSCSVLGCAKPGTVVDGGTEHENWFCDAHGELAEETSYMCFSGQDDDGNWILKPVVTKTKRTAFMTTSGVAPKSSARISPKRDGLSCKRDSCSEPATVVVDSQDYYCKEHGEEAAERSGDNIHEIGSQKNLECPWLSDPQKRHRK